MSSDVVRKYIVSTEKSGDLQVYVQGDLSQQGKRAIFLTVHDLGCNHTSFHDFVNHPCMCEIKERSVFIYIDVPGHEDNAPNLTIPFPTLQVLGEDLVTVLDFLHVKYVIGLGEGAGANILARFGLAYPTRVLGLILINCTGSAASVLDTFKSKFVNWKGESSVSQSAEEYLVFHKFGNPYKVAQSILLFCKGQGLLTSLTLPGVDRQRAFSGGSFDSEGGPRRLSRGMSMEEYDKPNIRRLSITISNDGVSNKHN